MRPLFLAARGNGKSTLALIRFLKRLGFTDKEIQELFNQVNQER